MSLAIGLAGGKSKRKPNEKEKSANENSFSVACRLDTYSSINIYRKRERRRRIRTTYLIEGGGGKSRPARTEEKKKSLLHSVYSRDSIWRWIISERRGLQSALFPSRGKISNCESTLARHVSLSIRNSGLLFLHLFSRFHVDVIESWLRPNWNNCPPA